MTFLYCLLHFFLLLNLILQLTVISQPFIDRGLKYIAYVPITLLYSFCLILVLVVRCRNPFLNSFNDKL